MSDITIKAISNNIYGVNSYVLISSGEAIIIDAPEINKSNASLDDYKKALDGVEPKFIVYTHGHFDHISGRDIFSDVFKNAKHLIHEHDLIAFTDARYNASLLFGQGQVFTKADTTFKDGDTIDIGDNKLLVIHTPGHTRGGCCFYNKENKMLITGDTLFTYGIGRTDFDGGDENIIIESITKKLFTLDDDTLIYPGHSEYATKLGDRKNMGTM